MEKENKFGCGEKDFFVHHRIVISTKVRRVG
jgi:hypothetical protein